MGDLPGQEASMEALTNFLHQYRTTIRANEIHIRNLEEEVRILRATIKNIVSAIPTTLRDPSDNLPVTMEPGVVIPPKRVRVSTPRWWETPNRVTSDQYSADA